MANQFLHALKDAWNSIGTVFDAIKMNVTDSASDAASKLINLQVNNAEKFTVDKAGNLVAAGNLKGKTILLDDAFPIASGGTGGKTAEEARTALGVVAKAGDRMTGSLSSKVVDHGTKGSVTEEFKYADGNTHKVTVNGALIINPTGLAEGDVMQINVLYQSGGITLSGTTQWDLGAGQKSTAFADLGVTLAANTVYRISLEMAGGLRTGLFL